jgi:hypothetical protein
LDSRLSSMPRSCQTRGQRRRDRNLAVLHRRRAPHCVAHQCRISILPNSGFAMRLRTGAVRTVLGSGVPLFGLRQLSEHLPLLCPRRALLKRRLLLIGAQTIAARCRPVLPDEPSRPADPMPPRWAVIVSEKNVTHHRSPRRQAADPLPTGVRTTTSHPVSSAKPTHQATLHCH